MLQNLKRLFSKEVSLSSVVFIRLCFGLVMMWEVTRYFKYNWIKTHYIDPQYYFGYEGFEWITPWTGSGMYIHFIVLGILALFIFIGFLYRISATLFFFCFSYIFFLEKSYYLNHFYLIAIISFLLIWIPANRSCSVDSLLFPKFRHSKIPFWTVWILRFQIAVPYFFGGLAKINSDWLNGEPMRTWLTASAAESSIASIIGHPLAPWFFSYGGLAFDLLIVPALLWKRTRKLAFTIAVLFHLTNAFIFHIGIFPWFMIAATTIFFVPDWCEGVLNKFNFFNKKASKDKLKTKSQIHPLLFSGLIIFILWQTLFPLRHFIIPGNVHWTEEGHRFSWHMKLRDKSSVNVFFTTDESGKKSRVPLDNYLTKRQQAEMGTQPDMMWQFAQYLKSEYQKEGIQNVKITVASFCSLNGRPNQLFVKPDFDLAGLKSYKYPADWIAPLNLNLETH